MNEGEIKAKAQSMVDQKIREVQDSRQHLVKTMVEAGYNPEDYVIMDNWEAFKNGDTTEYICWSSKRLPNEV